MKFSSFFIPTLKNIPAEAEIISHQLMIRAGMIKQASAGIYSWLPLGLKVLKKIDPNSPHETILILDATTGQSALNQVEEFQKITPISGLIMTKLDGTAKGGILLAIARKYNLPIIAIGLGEKEDDLELFRAEDYAKALMSSN